MAKKGNVGRSDPESLALLQKQAPVAPPPAVEEPPVVVESEFKERVGDDAAETRRPRGRRKKGGE